MWTGSAFVVARITTKIRSIIINESPRRFRLRFWDWDTLHVGHKTLGASSYDVANA